MGESNAAPAEILIHPEHGPLRARRVLDCVFALLPEGRILHRHIDDLTLQMSPDQPGDDVSGDTVQPGSRPVRRYVLGDLPPSPAHARCRIIPPRVREF